MDCRFGIVTKGKFTFSDNSDTRTRARHSGRQKSTRDAARPHTLSFGQPFLKTWPTRHEGIFADPGGFIVDPVVNNTDPNLTNTDTLTMARHP